MAKKTGKPTHRAIGQIHHDGDFYGPGDGIVLTDDQAAELGSAVEVYSDLKKSSNSQESV